MNYFREYFLEIVKNKYATFDGRARRKEFWMFVLISIIISIVLSIIDSILGFGDGRIGILGSLYSLAVLVPTLAIGARRLHDTDRSGWWQLVGIIPILGWIALIVLFVIDSKPGANKYGPNPKEGAPVTPAPAV